MMISMMHTQCVGQHSRNTRDGIGDTYYIHIIHISSYIISYHIISYYVYTKVTLYNMFAVLNI